MKNILYSRNKESRMDKSDIVESTDKVSPRLFSKKRVSILFFLLFFLCLVCLLFFLYERYFNRKENNDNNTPVEKVQGTDLGTFSLNFPIDQDNVFLYFSESENALYGFDTILNENNKILAFSDFSMTGEVVRTVFSPSKDSLLILTKETNLSSGKTQYNFYLLDLVNKKVYSIDSDSIDTIDASLEPKLCWSDDSTIVFSRSRLISPYHYTSSIFKKSIFTAEPQELYSFSGLIDDMKIAGENILYSYELIKVEGDETYYQGTEEYYHGLGLIENNEGQESLFEYQAQFPFIFDVSPISDEIIFVGITNPESENLSERGGMYIFNLNDGSKKALHTFQEPFLRDAVAINLAWADNGEYFTYENAAADESALTVFNKEAEKIHTFSTYTLNDFDGFYSKDEKTVLGTGVSFEKWIDSETLILKAIIYFNGMDNQETFYLKVKNDGSSVEKLPLIL